MEEDRILRRALHHHGRDAEALEVLLALLLLVFLALDAQTSVVDDGGAGGRFLGSRTIFTFAPDF